jgi:exosortase/archaeosortase family protein
VLFFKSAIIVASVVAMYYSDLALIFGNALEFTTGNITNYVLTIPFMSAFIIYRKRKILLAVALHGDKRLPTRFRFDDMLGITLCVIAVLIYLAGSATLYALEFHILTLPIFLAGGTVLVFNLATLRHALVAILLTIYIQPPPGQLVSELAADLSWTSAVMVEGLLGSAGLPISLDTSFGAPALVIENAQGNRMPFFVGEPSSGVFSTIGLSLFAVFVAYVIRGPTWKRILLFLSGFPLFFLLNTVRIAMVLSLWYFFGEEVSETYHTISGSSMVALGTLGVLFLGEKALRLNIRTPTIRTKGCPMCSKCTEIGESMCISCGRTIGKAKQKMGKSSERIAFITFIALIMTFLITSGISGAVDSRKLSNLDIVSVQGPETTEYLLPEVEGWDLRYAYRDNRVESILNQDAALAFRYVSTTQAGDTMVTNPSLFASVQISNGHHVWEDSLVTFPSRVGRPGATLIESDDIVISEGKEGRYLLFKRIGSTSSEAVIYWFERTPLKFGTEFENRNVLISIWANTNALSSSGIISDPNDSLRIKELYLSLARPIAAYWEEQSDALNSSNELLYAYVNKNLIGLLILAVFPISIFLMILIARKVKPEDDLNRLYGRLALDDRTFIQAIDTMKNKQSTGEHIRKSYFNITNKELSNERLIELLSSGRKAGLIINQITSVNDESILVWKSNLNLKIRESKIIHFSRIQTIQTFHNILSIITKMKWEKSTN